VLKLGVLLDNVSPKELNQEVFRVLRTVYERDKLVSANIFAKHLNWPYTDVPYGIFKWNDYQSFDGTTIVTNLELLSFVKEVPHNNKIILYCNSFPWVDSNIPAKTAISLLTDPKLSVYCKVDYIKDFLETLNIKSTVCSFQELVDKTLWP